MRPFDQARFAVIADIHSNADALAAVLDDIDAQGIACIVNLGDHVSGPMAARETAEILMDRACHAIKGNHDRWVTENRERDMGSIDAVAFNDLDARHLQWLTDMPGTAHLSPEVFACHGTPASDLTYWLDTVSADGEIVLRPRSEIEEEASGITASLFLCGHTHLPRRADLPGGRVVLNPGSVGCPGYRDDLPVPHTVQTGTAAACYAIVEQTERGWLSTFRHIPYDPRRMMDLATKADHPQWAARIASGWVTP